MSATPISLIVRVVDLRQTETSGTGITSFVLATSTNVLKSTVKNVLDACGTLEISLPFGDPVAPFLIAASGGSGFNGPILPYGLEFSYDGGATWDSAMWVENHTLDFSSSNFGIDMTGNDISDGFNRIYIDRVTFVDVACEDILYGDFGTIGIGDNSLIKSGPPWLPWQRGLLRSVPGRSSLKGGNTWLAFKGVMDSHLAGQRVTFDANQDSIMRCIQTLMKAIGGIYKPNNDSAPFGSRQHYTVDVKNRQVLAGYVGQTPKMTFVAHPGSGVDSYDLDETQFAYIDGESLTIEPTLQDMRAQVDFIGGQSNHGLPDGGKITCAVTINNQTPGTQINGNEVGPSAWDCSLLVVGVSTGDEGGGLFYLVDKDFYPISQQCDINALIVSANGGNELWAATNNGVIFGTFNYRQSRFATLGGLTASIAALHSQGDTITAIANSGDNGTGVNGVYIYPALSGDADNSTVGWAGWSRITLFDVVDGIFFHQPDFIYGGDGVFYYVDSSAPSTLIKHVINGTQKSVDTTNLTYQFEGFDEFNFEYIGTTPLCVIRTSGGALGTSCIYEEAGPSLQILPFNAFGLSDQFGALAVNKVIAYPPLWSINGVNVTFLAATDRGLYYCIDLNGSQWYPASGQNGVTDVTGTWVAAGTIQSVMGRPVIRLFVGSDTTVFVSNTGGIYFQDILSLPLDLGPAFYALAQDAGQIPFPDNNVGGLAVDATTVGNGGSTIGSIPPLTGGFVLTNQDLEDNGGSGTVVFVPAGNVLAPAAGLVFCRRLTERNEFTYRVIDVTCEAPYNAIEPSQLSEMAANDATDALTGSVELLVEHYRYLLICRQPKITVNMTASFTTQEAALRTLLAGDMVAINYAITAGDTNGDHSYTIIDLSQQNWYVWDKTMSTGTVDGIVEVQLTLVSVAGFSAIDLQEIVSAVANGFSRDRRFRSWHVR